MYKFKNDTPIIMQHEIDIACKNVSTSNTNDDSIFITVDMLHIKIA